MYIKTSKQVEQVTLEFMVQNAFVSFSKTLLSIRANVLLLGGFIDQKTAVKSYLAKRKSPIDRRKKLSEQEEAIVLMVEAYAEDADEYVRWVKSEGGLPVWREALVSYCTAFENCLKTIAVAFLLADKQSETGLQSPVIIPSGDLSSARRRIAKQWSDIDGDMPRVRSFFERDIRLKKAAENYNFLLDNISELDWDVCNAAFQVRNAIIHNMGYMPYSVSLGNLELHASWQAEVNQNSIAVVGRAFTNILAPFDSIAKDLGL